MNFWKGNDTICALDAYCSLGEAAYERALAENLSSRWTDQESLAIRVSYGDEIEA